VIEPGALCRDYAARMLRIAGVADAAVEGALARIPREAFLGPPPWTILDPTVGAIQATDADPRPLYQDVLVVLDRARGLNNGSPSLHALMLHHLDVRPGERVLHVGAGAGYYTAVLAELAGTQGSVVAIEYDPRLAEAARANLHPWPNVTLVAGDGADWPDGPVQRIYVNFAVADPTACWIDNLTAGGTLVFPLGSAPSHAHGHTRRHSGNGAVLVCTRTASGIAVRHLTPCVFVCAEGRLAGTPALQDALGGAFLRGGIEFVRSYCRPPPPSPERCWFWSPAWALSYDALSCGTQGAP
jgi:protein-L-isoaspartate(D-aspartate) O-methyltransferase